MPRLLATAISGVAAVYATFPGSAAASVAFSLRTLASPSLLAAPSQRSDAYAGGAAVPASGRAPFTVTLRAPRVVVRNGHAAKLTGRVAPRAAHQRVALQVRAGGRWRTVASRSLSKSSTFAFTPRLRGVGGHFLRVVQRAGSGHAQGISNIVELIVPGRKTVRSHGGALRVSLGAVSVSAPKGAIGKGQTLSISVGASTGFGSEVASSVAGGPYLLSTSQGEPRQPVTVTVGYDPGLLTRGDKPLLLHGWTATHKWVPEITTVHGHSVSTTLDSFSPIDVVDWATYYAGILTGNRASLPTGCGPTPSWIDSATIPDSSQDPLPACFSSKSDQAEAVLNIVNNRGYAQTVTVSGAKIDIARSVFASSVGGEIDKALAAASAGGTGPSAFELAPGEGVSVAIDRPPPQLAAQDIHIDTASKVTTGVGELAYALLSTAKDQIQTPLDVENCIMGAVYNTVSAGRGQDTAIAQMHSCIDAGATGAAKDVLEKLAYGLLVDDFFYKVVNLFGDEMYPTVIGFTIPGSNPSATNPNIHIENASYGTLPDGKTTIEHLTATGGTPPYRYYIWNEPENAAKVPSWVSLATDGTLTIEPPAGASGEVSFYVYAFDSKNEHSPFKRDQVSFQTHSGPGGPGAGGTTSSNGILWTAIEAPMPVNAEPDSGSALRSASCAGRGRCVAVGGYIYKENSGDTGNRGLIESLVNGVWSATPAPSLTGASTGSTVPYLGVVSCDASDTCAALSEYHGPVETLTNGTWWATELPLPADAGLEGARELESVSCSGEGFCVAVGSWSSNSGSGGLIETLADGAWHATTPPLPAGAKAAAVPRLTSVSCAGQGSCVAVGQAYEDTSGHEHPLIETLANGVWIATGAPLPSDVWSTAEPWLASVSCASEGSCVAVGGYRYSSTENAYHALVETLSGGVWAAAGAPLPSNATGANSRLESVSCAGPSSCLAGGGYWGVFACKSSCAYNIEEGWGPMLETLTADAWAATGAATGAPVSGDAPAYTYANSGRGWVACRADGSCAAIGLYNNETPIVETTMSGGLTATELSLPPWGVGLDGAYTFGSVSCAPAWPCVAVGSYRDSNGYAHPLIEIGESET